MSLPRYEDLPEEQRLPYAIALAKEAGRRWEKEKARAEAAEAERDLYMEQATEAHNECVSAMLDRDRLRAALGDAKVTVMAAAEWHISSSIYGNCPFCRATPLQGHAPDCPRQRALGVAP